MNTTPTPAEPATVVRRETINNILIGIAITVLVTWLLFRGEASTPALSNGGILGILPATFNVTFLITLGMTLGARRRIRSGRIKRPIEGEGSSVARLLPRNVFLRAISLALAMFVIFVPATLLAVQAAIRLGIVPEHWSMAGFMLFYITYFILLTAVITPIIIWRGLRD